jgi:hypothetical protein
MSKQSKVELYELPFLSQDLWPEVRLLSDGDDIIMQFEVDAEGSNERYLARIMFRNCGAIRRLNEPCSRVWNIRGCYDRLNEVIQSDWLKEVQGKGGGSLDYYERMRHFMIYLESSGSFEFIAESYEVLPNEKI